jgi:hypothetical protein
MAETLIGFSIRRPDILEKDEGVSRCYSRKGGSCPTCQCNLDTSTGHMMLRSGGRLRGKTSLSYGMLDHQSTFYRLLS